MQGAIGFQNASFNKLVFHPLEKLMGQRLRVEGHSAQQFIGRKIGGKGSFICSFEKEI